MAGFSAILATSEAIRATLYERRPRINDDLSTLSVKLVRPEDFQLGKVPELTTGVAIVLYRVGPSSARRTLPARVLPDGRHLRPPLVLDLHYLICVYGQTSQQQQLALGWCSRTLYEQAIIPAATLNRFIVDEIRPSPPDPMLAESLRFFPDEAVELNPEALSLQDLSQFCDGMRPVLGLGYTARVVRIDSPIFLDENPPVRERIFYVGEPQL
jgi:hypothetical protein